MKDRDLHKAKRLDNGEWEQGFYVLCRGHHYILPVFDTDNGFDERYAEWVEVDPSTLCQCTGLEDKNDKLIWENDVVRFSLSGELGIFEYREDIAAFTVCNLEKTRTSFVADWKDKTEIEVIGNIFDNPELLEVVE